MLDHYFSKHPAGLSKVMCLHAGTDWLKLVRQSEGGERSADDLTLSIMSGRFVAATMVTPLSSTTPSISVRSCVRTLSATLFPPLDLKGLTTMTVQ